MRSLRPLLLPASLFALLVHAQSPVPITTSTDHFLAFRNGAFEELDARKPQAVFQNGERMAYITDAGDLKLYDDGKVTDLQRGETVDFKGSKYQMAWKVGPSLRVPKDNGSESLCRGTGEFTVTDSLVVYHDQLNQTLVVYWRNRLITVADVLMVGDGAQWSAGSNTVLFFDRGAQRVLLFYRGATSVLCNGSDVARVAPGGDVVAYMDDRDETFRVFDKGEIRDIEPFAPISFRTGNGLAAYVSNGGAFRCYRNGSVYNLLDFAPTDYWVQDSVLLFVDQGMLKTFSNNAVDIVERFIPEQWAVCGDMIAYLDLNRSVRVYRNGVRTQVSKEAGVKHFDLYPGALTYRSNSGISKVWWKGKVYEHY